MASQSLIERCKNTLMIRSWALWNVPLINMMSPRVENLDDHSCSVLIPLNFWTKNHFRSMYISSQVTGADLCAGLLAQHHIRKHGKNVKLIFKDLHGSFKKRPDADTLFTCTDGDEIGDLVAQVSASGKREERTVHVFARCPKKYGDEVLSEFTLTLSLKKA